ncbi:MAG: hypothetical protein ABW061_10680 [Polyangiaceae bacterium]
MRSGYFFAALLGTMFATALASAQAAPADGDGAPGAAAAPGPPPGGYPPPPPGGYPPPPPGYYGPEAPPLERQAKNSIYIEGLGPGILYSINYDRNIGDFAGRVGFSYIGLSARSGSDEAHASLITVPITATYLGLGSKKHMFEIGGGVTIVHVSAGANSFAVSDSKSENSNTLLLGNLVFGYRMQPPEGGFLLRTGISPIFGGGAFIPLPYLALGGTF